MPEQPAPGERDLHLLLRRMEPELRSGEFVFSSTYAVPPGAEVFAWIREDEGVTLILDRLEADRLGLTYGFVAAQITLRVHSALEAVGLTSAVSTALGEAGISCNVIAGYFHDHLFVPVADGRRAVQVLRELAASG